MPLPLLPPPPRSANASRHNSGSSTPTNTWPQPNAIASSSSPRHISRSPDPSNPRQDGSFANADASFGSFAVENNGQDVIGGLGGRDVPGQRQRGSVDLMDFSSPSKGSSHTSGPPLPSNIHRLGHMPTSTGKASESPDLLGSFGDHTTSGLLQGAEASSSSHHHDGVKVELTPLDALEEELLRSDLKRQGDGADPRLQPYKGPDADLPVPMSASTSSTSYYPIPSASTHSPFAHTSPSFTTEHHIPTPPRRLSQYQSFSGPSSPPVISAHPGDSFVFRARTHSFTSRDQEVPDDVVQPAVGQVIEGSQGQSGYGRGGGRSSVIDLLEDYEGSGQVYGRVGAGHNTGSVSHRNGNVDAASGSRRLSASSSSPPPTGAARRLSSSFLRGPTGVGLFPRKSSSPGRPRPSDSPPMKPAGKGDRAGAKFGGHQRGATMPATTRKSGEFNERPFPDDPDTHDDDGVGDSEWGNYRRSPVLGGAESSLAGMTKKFGLASLSGASKATDTIKSKWKTVLGPGTFSGSPTSPSSFASGSNNFNAMRFGGGIEQDKIEELDKPTPTAQPITISSSTPFHSGDPYAGGWAAPNGAPGFRNPDGLNGSLAPLPGSEHGSGRVEDWSGTKLVGRRGMTTPVLDEHCADALRPSLPARQRLSNTWTLLFSLDQHGGSISTFYRLIEMHLQTHKFAGNVLIIRDTLDRRFGVYMNESIKRVDGSYFGSGESWLFKIVGDDLDVRARTFKWTGRNQYFALCEGGFISFGGGDGKTGLYLDASFVSGSSAVCPAYNNEVLCAEEGSTKVLGRFDCVGLEVWGTS